jgi:hypothetical protein
MARTNTVSVVVHGITRCERSLDRYSAPLTVAANLVRPHGVATIVSCGDWTLDDLPTHLEPG